MDFDHSSPFKTNDIWQHQLAIMDEEDNFLDKEWERRKRKEAFLAPDSREKHEKRAKRVLGVKTTKGETSAKRKRAGLESDDDLEEEMEAGPVEGFRMSFEFDEDDLAEEEDLEEDGRPVMPLTQEVERKYTGILHSTAPKDKPPKRLAQEPPEGQYGKCDSCNIDNGIDPSRCEIFCDRCGKISATWKDEWEEGSPAASSPASSKKRSRTETKYPSQSAISAATRKLKAERQNRLKEKELGLGAPKDKHRPPQGSFKNHDPVVPGELLLMDEPPAEQGAKRLDNMQRAYLKAWIDANAMFALGYSLTELAEFVTFNGTNRHPSKQAVAQLADKMSITYPFFENHFKLKLKYFRFLKFN